MYNYDVQEYDGINFYRVKGRDKKYFMNKKSESKLDRTAMHLYVWIKNNGAIAEGHVIHHIDHNKANNSLSNLVCWTRSKHMSHHALNPSRETRRKMSIYQKNKIVSEETRKKISKANKGNKHSEETKKRMSLIALNRSEEIKKKMGCGKKGKTWKVVNNKRVWMEINK